MQWLLNAFFFLLKFFHSQRITNMMFNKLRYRVDPLTLKWFSKEERLSHLLPECITFVSFKDKTVFLITLKRAFPPSQKIPLLAIEQFNVRWKP